MLLLLLRSPEQPQQESSGGVWAIRRRFEAERENRQRLQAAKDALAKAQADAARAREQRQAEVLARQADIALQARRQAAATQALAEHRSAQQAASSAFAEAIRRLSAPKVSRETVESDSTPLPQFEAKTLESVALDSTPRSTDNRRRARILAALLLAS